MTALRRGDFGNFVWLVWRPNDDLERHLAGVFETEDDARRYARTIPISEYVEIEEASVATYGREK